MESFSIASFDFCNCSSLQLEGKFFIGSICSSRLTNLRNLFGIFSICSSWVNIFLTFVTLQVGKRDGQLLYPNRVAVVKTSGDIIVTER